jgi:hypothetical protein
MASILLLYSAMVVNTLANSLANSMHMLVDVTRRVFEKIDVSTCTIPSWDCVQKELLDGDNKYDAEKYGKQDAYRCQCIAKLPPVLQLHLLRFQFNYATGTSYKVCCLLLPEISISGGGTRSAVLRVSALWMSIVFASICALQRLTTPES